MGSIFVLVMNVSLRYTISIHISSTRMLFRLQDDCSVVMCGVFLCFFFYPCAGRFFFDLGLHFLMDWSSGNSAQGSTRGGHELSAACGILEL
jgi:hypothetical protein